MPDFSALFVEYEIRNIKLIENSDGVNYSLLFTLVDGDDYMDIQLTKYSTQEEIMKFETLSDYSQHEDNEKVILISNEPPYHAIMYFGLYKANISTSLEFGQFLESLNNITL